jgi:APA family basic amino acid/polyamine antiporter
MARIETHGLRRSVGLGGLFATAYGNVGSSIYYALGIVALYALGFTPVIFMVAGGLFALTAKTYAEGAAMIPEAGGSSSFARYAFNELVSFFAGWALSLDYILTIAISAFFVPHYLGAFWPALTHPPGDVIGGLVVIGVLAALNIRGIGESAKLNFFLAIADLVTQGLIILLGAFLVLDPGLLVRQVHLGTVPTYSHLIFALSLSMLAYTGIETVSNMAEEARDPGRDVPRAVNLILIAVIAVYAGMTVVALSALPVVGHGTHAHTLLGSKFEADPVLGIIENLGLPGAVAHILRYYVGVLAATILFIATNAGLIGISRLSWSLAEHKQLPGIFARLHRRFRTPWFTIVTFSVFAGVLLIPGQINFLGNLYSFGAMLSFTTAHAAMIALRIKEPDRERPYRMPWNVPFRGRQIPLTAVFGGIATFAAWISVLALHVDARYVGTGWMVVGLIGYVVYRRSQGLDLRSHHKIERRQRPAFFVELEYRSAIVPIFGTDVDASALRAAAKLVGEGALVQAIYILRVPNQLSLDAGLEEEEQRGMAVLESAKVTGRRSGLKVQTRLVRTRSPGAAIVEEAERQNAEIIYLATNHAPPSERALGPTASYLLAHRPCRVVIETPPAEDARKRVQAGDRNHATPDAGDHATAGAGDHATAGAGDHATAGAGDHATAGAGDHATTGSVTPG